jgi:hypothetical protein
MIATVAGWQHDGRAPGLAAVPGERREEISVT